MKELEVSFKTKVANGKLYIFVPKDMYIKLAEDDKNIILIENEPVLRQFPCEPVNRKES